MASSSNRSIDAFWAGVLATLAVAYVCRKGADKTSRRKDVQSVDDLKHIKYRDGTGGLDKIRKRMDLEIKAADEATRSIEAYRVDLCHSVVTEKTRMSAEKKSLRENLNFDLQIRDYRITQLKKELAMNE